MCGFVWDGELLRYYCFALCDSVKLPKKNIWSDTTPTGKLNGMSTPPPPKKPGVLTLPEGEEDDRLHHEELEHRVVRNEEFACGEVEEEERVEWQTDGDVVDYGHIKVAASHTGTGRHNKKKKKKSMFSWEALSKTFLKKMTQMTLKQVIWNDTRQVHVANSLLRT